jgi:hypothetical protein
VLLEKGKCVNPVVEIAIVKVKMHEVVTPAPDALRRFSHENTFVALFLDDFQLVLEDVKRLGQVR